MDEDYRRTPHCKPMGGSRPDTTPSVPAQVNDRIYEQTLGIRYCPDMEPILPIYDAIPYKANTSKNINYKFSFGIRVYTDREAMMDKNIPSKVDRVEQRSQEDMDWLGSREEDLPGHGSLGVAALNTPTLPEKGWEEWEECVLPAAGGLTEQDDHGLQPGGGGARELAGGGAQRDGARGAEGDGVQGDDQPDQADRSRGECVPDRLEEFQRKTVTELISSWEVMEKGGEEGEKDLSGGMEEGGGRRRKSQNFQNLHVDWTV